MLLCRRDMLTPSFHEPNEQILRDLHHAIERLANTVEDEAPMAAALRRFARRLPLRATPTARKPRPMRDLLYRALDEGAIDAPRFDWLMLAENRLARRPSIKRASIRR